MNKFFIICLIAIVCMISFLSVHSEPVNCIKKPDNLTLILSGGRAPCEIE